MIMHELKTINPYFTDTWDGKKPFEIRFNDRSFKTGDLLWLREYDREEALVGGTDGYSGREMICEVLNVLPENTFEGLTKGYCAMTIKILRMKEKP
jgi:ParB family transcriptional regulator, chromosome partitioning protein